MKQLTTILLLLLSTVVVACEGTIELGEDSPFQGLATGSTTPDAKADSLGAVTGPTGGATSDGEALYQQNCAACHGADATGGASWPGSIVGYADIAPIVSTGRGNMAPVAIDAGAIDAIQTYLTSLAAEQPADSGTTPALEIYASTCAGCHGAEGEGSPNGPQLRFRDDELSRFTVRNGRNGQGNPSAMPSYTTDQLSDEQLDEILAWLSSFPNPADGEGLYVQYCANCHGADGLGGHSTEPLAGRFSVGDVIREGKEGGFAQRSDYMSAWTPEELSDEEVALIEAYMRNM